MASVDRSGAMRRTQAVNKCILYFAHVSVCCVEASAGPHVYVSTRAYIGKKSEGNCHRYKAVHMGLWLKDWLYSLI